MINNAKFLRLIRQIMATVTAQIKKTGGKIIRCKTILTNTAICWQDRSGSFYTGLVYCGNLVSVKRCIDSSCASVRYRRLIHLLKQIRRWRQESFTCWLIMRFTMLGIMRSKEPRLPFVSIRMQRNGPPKLLLQKKCLESLHLSTKFCMFVNQMIRTKSFKPKRKNDVFNLHHFNICLFSVAKTNVYVLSSSQRAQTTKKIV
jgi:hypothetical protein